ncbi:MAG: hypothetical protein FJ247_11160 [Nitrospira sp.]|nr:hypothetical protein [Nitrospira sp.]
MRHIPDSQIDFSDVPELSDEQLKRMKRVGRPVTGLAKQLIAIRLSPRLLAGSRWPWPFTLTRRCKEDS